VCKNIRGNVNIIMGYLGFFFFKFRIFVGLGKNDEKK